MPRKWSSYPLSPIAHSWDMGMMRTVLPSSRLCAIQRGLPPLKPPPTQACAYLQPSTEFGKSVAATAISEAVATGVTIIPQESHGVSTESCFLV